MKKKELQELKDKTIHELLKLLKEKKTEISALKRDVFMRKSKNTGGLRTVKKDIARIMTFLKQKEVIGK